MEELKNYWITIALLILLATLIRQNFFINEFQHSLTHKQQIIDEKKNINQDLKAKNTSKQQKLDDITSPNMEIIQSQARYRFELIKSGEIYYQINP